MQNVWQTTKTHYTYFGFLKCECNTDIRPTKDSGEACPNGKVTNVPLSSDKTPPTWRLCRPHLPQPFLDRLLFSASRFEGGSFVTAVVLATSLPGSSPGFFTGARGSRGFLIWSCSAIFDTSFFDFFHILNFCLCGCQAVLLPMPQPKSAFCRLPEREF